jgi:hypothetical protein
LPELDDLIGEWWNTTSAAADGMPPHITLLWPWKSASDISDGDLAAIADIAAQTPRLRLRLTDLDTFSGVLWLRPQPTDPLLGLMRRLWAAFPSHPPFGGSLPHEPIPHVTVIKAPDELLGAVAAEVDSRIGHRLPVHLDVADIAVSVEGAAPGGRWAPVRRFALGAE